MDDAERLSLLIGDIYDAALDPGRWPDVLGKVRDYVGGCAAGLYAKDASSKSGNLHYDDGRIEPRYAQLYFEKYVKVDPSNVRHFFGEICEPHHRIRPPETLRRIGRSRQYLSPPHQRTNCFG